MALSVRPIQGNWQVALTGFTMDKVHELIAQVRAERCFGDGRPQSRIFDAGRWRLDREPGSSEEVNLQIQRNGRRSIGGDEPTTVAVALIPVRYNKSLGPPGSLGFASRAGELTNALQEALNRSFRSHRHGDPTTHRDQAHAFVQAYTVQGEFSSPVAQ